MQGGKKHSSIQIKIKRNPLMYFYSLQRISKTFIGIRLKSYIKTSFHLISLLQETAKRNLADMRTQNIYIQLTLKLVNVCRPNKILDNANAISSKLGGG